MGAVPILMAVVQREGRVGGAGDEKLTCSGGIGGGVGVGGEGSWGSQRCGVSLEVGLLEWYVLRVCESVICGGRS